MFLFTYRRKYNEQQSTTKTSPELACLISASNSLVQLLQCLIIMLILLCINNKNQGAAVSKNLLCVERCRIEEVDLTREIQNIEVNKWTTSDAWCPVSKRMGQPKDKILTALLDLARALQKHRFVRWHLVEHNFHDGRLTAPELLWEQSFQMRMNPAYFLKPINIIRGFAPKGALEAAGDAKHCK